jgi:SAM-dependent methyltransferase
MFPLQFPVSVLRNRLPTDRSVLDPFCGRGTTNFAARLSGLRSVGIDSSPVAVAIAAAKISSSTSARVVDEAGSILKVGTLREAPPSGEFWRRAYQMETLRELCVLRDELLRDCASDARILLRAIVMGALHGPTAVEQQAYFSNQCPRTFAPKPRYAVAYWKREGLKPPRVDVLGVIRRRATRFLASQPKRKASVVVLGDSRRPETMSGPARFDWVITSPPYYGMRSYIPDQWLRSWFVGGPAYVDYSQGIQLDHGAPESFIADLAKVWRNAANASRDNARLVCRFGGIHDRRADPLEIARESFRDSGWRLLTARSAGTALDGRRQAKQFSGIQRRPRKEYDFYARRS